MKGISDQVAGLTELSRPELVELWINAHKGPPPKGIGRRLLELSAAYAVQVRMFGDIDRSTKRALAVASFRSVGTAEEAVTQQTPSRALATGSRLVRVWNGKTHQVEVLETGFVWNDRRYRSLSAIAREITGARWSGPRFFGL
jgi:hypothetical protein